MSIELYREKNLLNKTDKYIPLPSDTKEKLNYFSDRIATLEYELDKFKRENKELKKYEAVKEFYITLSGYCIDMNMDANILQCGFRVINKKCTIINTCKTREAFLKKVGVS